ncbi:hypothetical protein GCM10022293_20810 [Azospirillum formosense]
MPGADVLASDCRNCAGMEQRPFLSTLLTYVDRKMAIGLTNAPLIPLPVFAVAKPYPLLPLNAPGLATLVG